MRAIIQVVHCSRVLYKTAWRNREASWAGCRWRQERGIAAICSYMFELALVNKIQELTAWKCLGAQCFLWECDHWGWGQSLPFSTGVDFGAKQVSHQPAESPVTLQGRGILSSSIDGMVMCLGLSFNPQDTATCGKLSDFSHEVPFLGRAYFIQYGWEEFWEYG